MDVSEHPIQPSFEQVIVDQIASIAKTVDILATAVETIECKFDEFLKNNGNIGYAPCPTQNSNSRDWSTYTLPPSAPDPLLNVYDHDENPTILSLNVS